MDLNRTSSEADWRLLGSGVELVGLGPRTMVLVIQITDCRKGTCENAARTVRGAIFTRRCICAGSFCW